MALHLIDGLTTRPAQFPSKISPAHAGSNIIINGADLFPRRAQKPSATFLGENVAWEKSTVN
jgi:hypothetical protein